MQQPKPLLRPASPPSSSRPWPTSRARDVAINALPPVAGPYVQPNLQEMADLTAALAASPDIHAFFDRLALGWLPVP